MLLRMAGKSQSKCAEILHTTRQNISIEEQEQRFSDRVAEYAALLTMELVSLGVLHESYQEMFPLPADLDDAQRLRKRVHA